MTPPAIQPKHTRRWLRFSLRTLLVLSVALSLALAWLGNTLIRIRQQRKIVAQVQEAGGRVTYDYQIVDQPPGIHRPGEPPKPPGPKLVRMWLGDDAFARVISVDTWNGSNDPTASDDDLRPLAELPALESLRLHDAGFTDKAMTHVVKLNSLKHLFLYDTQITADGLAQLSALDNLAALDLGGGTVTDNTTTRLDELLSIQRLCLLRTKITSEGLAKVKGLTHLRELRVYDAPALGDEGMRYVLALTELESLDTIKTSISDDGLAQLRPLARIRHLRLDSSAVTDAGLEHLAAFPKLQALWLGSTRISGEGLVHLAQLEELVHLDLSSTPLNDDGMETIARLHRLKSLDIVGCPNVSDAGILRLAALTHLEDLSGGPNITLAGAMKLKELLPKCRISAYGASGVGQFDLP